MISFPDSVFIFVQHWFAALDLERPTLQNAGQLDLLTHSVNPVRLKNNPVQLTEETLEELYRQILRVQA